MFILEANRHGRFIFDCRSGKFSARMNFLLMRSNQNASPDSSPALETQIENNSISKLSSSLEGLIAGEPFQQTVYSKNSNEGDYEHANENGGDVGIKGMGDHVDVTEDEGWITIPKKELPENWSEAPDITSLRSLDRLFVIPGEQLNVLACLSAYKQETEIITPFKVAALMNKNEVSSSESLLRLEEHKRQTESLLSRMNNSHFLARIAESDEHLWSKRKLKEDTSDKVGKKMKNELSPSTTIERGNFDAIKSGGVARNAVKCSALPNGDIVGADMFTGKCGCRIFQRPNTRNTSI